MTPSSNAGKQMGQEELTGWHSGVNLAQKVQINGCLKYRRH